jgi:hypothetical protein
MVGADNRTSVTVELGSLLLSAEERFAKQLKQLQPGAVVLA